MDFGGKQNWILIWPLPLSICVTRGTLINSCGSPVRYLQNINNNIFNAKLVRIIDNVRYMPSTMFNTASKIMAIIIIEMSGPRAISRYKI